MKIKAERKALAETVAWVGQATPKRVQTPALAAVHLTATSGRLVARAFDYDTSHAAVLANVEIINDGEALVPAAFLRDILPGLKGAQVELVLDAQTFSVTSGRSTYRTRVLALADYPTLPSVPPVKGFIDADALRELVATAAWAVDPDANVADITMAGITAVHIEGDTDGALTFVGTDRFVVSEAATAWTGDAVLEANVPLAPLVAAVKGLNGQVALAHEGGLFGLSDGDRTITTRTIEAGFPNWRPLMRPAADDDGAWTTDAPELTAAIKRTRPLIDEKSSLIFDADTELTLTIPSSEAGEGIEYLDAEHVEGDLPASFRMDPNKIGPALQALGGRSVRIGWKQGNKPVTLRSDDRPGVTMLVMPKRDLAGGPR